MAADIKAATTAWSVVALEEAAVSAVEEWLAGCRADLVVEPWEARPWEDSVAALEQWAVVLVAAVLRMAALIPWEPFN
jgi:hypothetical protein